MKRKKILILGFVFLGLLFLLIVSSEIGVFSKKVTDNTFYQKNEYTGDEDYVDPDQTKETTGPRTVSLRNGERLSVDSPNFFGEVRQRLEEFALYEIPEENVLYILTDTLSVDDNKYTFTVESSINKTKIEVVAYLTQQDSANVYINGNGPYNDNYPAYLDSENFTPD